MLDNYTRLLEEVAMTEDKEVADAAVSKLIHHMQHSGHLNMLPEIARELRKIAARRHSLRARVEVASEKESVVALRAAAELGINAKHAEVNHSLIRGWRARGAGKLVDRSAKSALVSIYQKVTV